MRSIFRVITVIVLLFGIVGLARNRVAWAANSSGENEQSALQAIDKPVAQAGDVDCKKAENKDNPKCKDRDKDKCKKNKDACGTVKPPPQQLLITGTGDYSVGGFCTLSVIFNDPEMRLNVIVLRPLPGQLPDKVQKVRQGCLLTYYRINQRIDELPTDSGSTTICFAATPAKQMTLYFYSRYASTPEWTSVETTVDAGRACGAGNASGVYVGAFQRP